MNLIEIKKIEPILEDDRGKFIEICNDLEINHIVITTFSKNAIRGNQYRNNMDQYFYLISGRLKIITQSIDGKNRTEHILSTSKQIFIPRKTAFVSIAEEDSILLEYSPQSYDPKNPDINRVKII